jgi:hypothetical protein
LRGQEVGEIKIWRRVEVWDMAGQGKVGQGFGARREVNRGGRRGGVGRQGCERVEGKARQGKEAKRPAERKSHSKESIVTQILNCHHAS